MACGKRRNVFNCELTIRKFFVFVVGYFFLVKTIVAANVIWTVAGDGNKGGGGDGGPAIMAQLYYPNDIAVDSMGNILIFDFRGQIRKVDKGTKIITSVVGTGVAGYSGDGGPAVNAQINFPRGADFDSGGNIFIADTFNNRIRKIDKNTGIITTVAGTGVAGYSGDGGPAINAMLDQPMGIALDSIGNIFIVDFLSRIRKVDKGTGIITTVAGTGIGGYSGDGGPAINAMLDQPMGIALDSIGNIFIADTYNNRIRKVDEGTGIISTVIGTGIAGYSGDGGPAINAQLDVPNDIALDSNGNIFIADRDNHRVRKVDKATGIISTVVGTGVAGFSGDGGRAINAQLNQPLGITLDSIGSIFVADNENHRIRGISFAPGVIEFDPQSLFKDAYTYDGPFKLKVKRVGGSAGKISAHYESIDGAAKSGVDFSPVSGDLTWEDGDVLDKEITVSPIDASPGSGITKSFSIKLSNSINTDLVGPQNTALITLGYSQLIQVINTPTTISEGIAGGQLTVNLERTGSLSQDISVDYSLTAGTAEAGKDFVSSSGKLNFLAGQPNSVINIPIINDSLVESDETFFLTLSNPSHGAVLKDPSPIMFTIIDDDISPGGFSFSKDNKFTLLEGVGDTTFKVERTDEGKNRLIITYEIVPHTALAGSDFIPDPSTTLLDGNYYGTWTWEKGDMSVKSIPIHIVDDNIFEKTETFDIVLVGNSSKLTAEIQILDDDAQPKPGDINFAASSVVNDVKAYDGPVSLKVSRSNGSAGKVTVHYVSVDGTAKAGVDFSRSEGDLTWEDGDSSDKVISIPLTDSSPGSEVSNNFSVQLLNPTGNASIGSQGTASIKVGYSQLIQVDKSRLRMKEDGGANSNVFIISRTGILDQDVSFDLEFKSGTAKEWLDFNPFLGGTIKFVAGESKRAFVMPIIDDNIVEPDETFDLVLTNPSHGAVLKDVTPITFTIVDNDVPQSHGMIGFSHTKQYSVHENEGEIVIDVERVGGKDGDIIAHYQTIDGSASSDDFVGGTGVVQFADGDDTPKQIHIKIKDDKVFEPLEKFQVIMTSIEGGGAKDTQPIEVQIVDDDSPSVAIDPPKDVPNVVLPLSKNMIDLSKGEQAEINIQMDRAGSARLEVYDRFGKKIVTVSEDFSIGAQTIHWSGFDSEGNQVAAGVYHAFVITPGQKKKIDLIVTK